MSERTNIVNGLPSGNGKSRIWYPSSNQKKKPKIGGIEQRDCRTINNLLNIGTPFFTLETQYFLTWFPISGLGEPEI